MSAVDRERALSRLAGAQDGVATLAQLREAGWSDAAVRHAVRSGRFRRLHRGVVQVAPGPAGARTRARAALLAVGGDAALAGRWAAWHLGFGPAPAAPVEVLVSSAGRKARKGIALRRVARLAREDATSVDGLRATSAERTLLDLARRVSARELEAALDQALVARRTSPRRIAAALARSAGTPGAPALRTLLDRHRGATRSELERLFRRFWTRTGLPPYEANVRVLEFTVDALWRDRAVVVELDSRGFHDVVTTRAEHDRRRSSRLTAMGFVVVRVGSTRLRDQPLALAAELGLVLGRATTH